MFNIFKYIIKTGKTSILRPFRLLKRKIAKSLFLKSKVGKAIKSSVKETIATIKRTPEKKSDYVLIGNHYFAKRIVIVIVALSVLILIIVQSLVIPFLRGRVFTPTISLSDQLLTDYSGKIKIINRDKFLVYKGKMENGKCSGYGIQYDDHGKLVYEGEFKDDFYSGSGVLYDSSQSIIYEGQFSNNLYSGNGKLYDSNHNLIYQGSFENGAYSGSGKIYENNKVLYAGNFIQGLENGYGVKYFGDGRVEYSGNFQNGIFSGLGTLYSKDMTKLYSGIFENGVFNGEGKLFLKNGDIAYEGNFSEGYYSGLGKLYGENFLYSGNFEKGYCSGQGDFYINDQEIYSGKWVNGSLDFPSFLGEESIAVANCFHEDGVLKIFDSKYSLKFEKAGCSFILNFPLENEEALIEKVIVTNFDLNGALYKEMSLDDAENIFTPRSKELVSLDLSDVYTGITEKRKFIVMHIEENQGILNLYFDLETYKLAFYEYAL